MLKTQKSDSSQEKWNKKRVLIALVILLFLIIGAFELKSYFLDSNSNPNSTKDVKGERISPVPTISLPSAQDIGQGVSKNLSNIQKEISNINVAELATSSPQIQKIVNDIKSLPSVPGQQAKDICLKVCSGL